MLDFNKWTFNVEAQEEEKYEKDSLENSPERIREDEYVSDEFEQYQDTEL